MYAILETGSKQYKVAVGETIKVEKLDAQVDEVIELKNVLALSDDSGLVVGKPYVEGASVKAKVLSQAKHKKVIIFKYLPKKDMRKKKGHRHPYTELEIEEIIR